MVASVSMTSGAELRYVAGLLRKAAARDLTRELRKGQRAAVRPLQREIKEEAAATLPKRGGYASTMAKAVKVAVTTGTGRKAMTVRIYARGKFENRDVVAVNAGRLRHPVFGNRKNWKVTTVRPGFAERPIDRLSDQILKESSDAAQRVIDSIARG